jgi:pilus assembly protein CpaB
VCTLVAAGILLLAASSYRHSVSASGQPETVFVASTLIQKGTPGDVVSSQNMFRTERIVAKQASVGAIADAVFIYGKVAATDIRPGQQLTLSDFSTGVGVVSQLAPAERAISIPLDTSHGLTGVIHPGDRVDVYAGLNTSVNRGNSVASAGASLRLLLSNVPVLSVGQSAAGGLGGGSVNQQSNVILKVNAGDAGALAFASDNGDVWLILRGANAKEPTTQKQDVYTLNSLLLNKPASGGRP